MSDATLAALATPALTHRSPEFKQHMANLSSRLRLAFGLSPSSEEVGTQSHDGEDCYSVVVVSGSGTAAMEMVIANRFTDDETVLVPTNGKFGERIAEICERHCKVTHLKVDWGRPFDHAEIDRILSEGNHEALAICHNETSTGIVQDAAALGLICKKHGVSFILDGITSVGGIDVKPVEWGADAVVVGSQKCTAGPSGVAAIAVSENYVEKSIFNRIKGGISPIYYLDLGPALKNAADDQTPWTPAINLILGWSAALGELVDEGVDTRIKRCANLASGVRKLFTKLGLELYATEGHQSNTVTAIRYPKPSWGEEWRSKLAKEYDTFVIGGQGHVKGRIFRIGTMGTTGCDEMIEGCNRMIACFNDFGLDLPKVDVASYFPE
jgi:aspartate aminotransferase-like enzyme